jgi:hypothetical protein
VALPDTLAQVWIVGTLHREDGSAVRGRVTFLPSTLSLTNQTTDDTYSLSAPFFAVLDADGYFEVKVPATDAPGFQPSGWTYTVREPLRRAYPIAVPTATPVLNSPGHPLHGQRVLDLSDAIPLPAPSAGSVQIVAPPAASPEVIAAAVQGYLDEHPPDDVPDLIDAAITTHVQAPAPHPAYDDLPSLQLLFENGLV